jgi:hypothetical protein
MGEDGVCKCGTVDIPLAGLGSLADPGQNAHGVVAVSLEGPPVHAGVGHLRWLAGF